MKIQISLSRKTYVDNSLDQQIADTLIALKNFSKWFGNSKILDAKRRPLVVYHGTERTLFKFSTAEIGSNTCSSFSGVGFYFADRKQVAQKYGSKIYECYLRIENPAHFTGDLEYDVKKFGLMGLKPKDSEHTLGEIIATRAKLNAQKLILQSSPCHLLYSVYCEFEGEEYVMRSVTESELIDKKYMQHRMVATILREKYGMRDIDNLGVLGNSINPYSITETLKQNGYDGIITDAHDLGGRLEYIAFYPNQIKSIANVGTFKGDSIYE